MRFTALDAVEAPARFATFLVEALELPASPTPPEAQLREHLRSRELLLVLDNLEHLLGATPLLAELLAHAPGLKLLVTSRERLNLRGEWLLPPGPRVPARADAALSMKISRGRSR